MKQTIQKGFTLIELMIVVAIIGILSAVALPAYQDYTARAQVSEIIVLSSGVKSAMSEYHADKGTWPVDNTAAGVAAPTQISGKYVESVTVAANVITGLMKTAGVATGVSGQNMVITGTASAGSYSWDCVAGGSIDVKYRPAACRP